MTANPTSSPRLEEASSPLWRHRAFGLTLALSIFAALSAQLWQRPLETALYEAESSIAARFVAEPLGIVGLFLIPLAGFGLGVLASVSPCILPLVPLNLAYIGASEASGRHALGLSARFVLGSALALTTLGLFGDVAGFLLIDHRGPLLLGAGLLMAYFGLAVLEIVPLLLHGSVGGRRTLGPIGAGAAFALVTTPCSSPLLAAALSAAATQSVAGLSSVTMLFFSLGYTMLVFLSGILGGGLVAWTRRVDFTAPRAAAAALLLVAGLTCIAAGAAWF